jgi:hypothetical protein
VAQSKNRFAHPIGIEIGSVNCAATSPSLERSDTTHWVFPERVAAALMFLYQTGDGM